MEHALARGCPPGALDGEGGALPRGPAHGAWGPARLLRSLPSALTSRLYVSSAAPKCCFIKSSTDHLFLLKPSP